MPRGSRHILEGRLIRRHGGLALVVNDGGVWRLDYLNNTEHLLGNYVRVEGTRDGFDLLAVESLVPLASKAGLPETRNDRLTRAGRVLRDVAMQVANRIRR